MMDMQNVVTAVQSVGFPIVVCFACFWYVKYISDRHREETKSTADRHSDEMKAITDALNNNTLALQKLVDKIDLICKDND